MTDLDIHPNHPAAKATVLNASFKNGPLMSSSVRDDLQPVCQALEDLHFKPMPWKVRLSVLFHGVIPKSYLGE